MILGAASLFLPSDFELVFIKFTVLMFLLSSGWEKSSIIKLISQTTILPSVVPETAYVLLGIKTVWVKFLLPHETPGE